MREKNENPSTGVLTRRRGGLGGIRRTGRGREGRRAVCGAGGVGGEATARYSVWVVG